MVASMLLKQREGDIAQGKMPGIHFDKVTFEELAQDLITDYEINELRSKPALMSRMKPLREYFGNAKAVDITTDIVKKYMNLRKNKGLSNAEINREMSVVKRMFSLAAQSTPAKVAQLPYIPHLKENNVREGFFEHEEYLKVHNFLPEYLKPVATFAYYTGWRKSEILKLTWDRVDLKEGTVRLESDETKNENPRDIYLEPELEEMFEAQMAKRRLGCPYVFHRNGKWIRDFYYQWGVACKKAGLKNRLFHDFRRTAVRNMVRAGIPEKVAMTISGHKTRNVFERYNIVSPEDLKQAALKRGKYLKDLTVTTPVTIEDQSEPKLLEFLIEN